jgi:lysophospholipase L1-like esterase
MRPRTTRTQVLSQSVVPCAFVDSTTFSRPGEWPTKDGAHLEPDGYRRWGTAIAEAIVRLKAQTASSH